MSLLLVSPDELQLYKRVCHTLKKPTGLPSFHINDNYMMAISKRVKIAKEIDQFTHKRKKVWEKIIIYPGYAHLIISIQNV